MVTKQYVMPFLAIIFCLQIASYYAAILYSSPNGSGNTCTLNNPCSLESAIHKLDTTSTIKCLHGQFKNLNLVISAKAPNSIQYQIDGSGEGTSFENVQFRIDSPETLEKTFSLLALSNMTMFNDKDHPLILFNDGLQQDVSISLQKMTFTNNMASLIGREKSSTNDIHVSIDNSIVSTSQLVLKEAGGAITITNVKNDNGAAILIDHAKSVHMTNVDLEETHPDAGDNMVSLSNIDEFVTLDDSTFTPAASRALFISMKTSTQQPNITMNNFKGAGNSNYDGGAFKLVNTRSDGSIVLNKGEFGMSSSMTSGGALSVEGNANLIQVTINSAFANEYGGAIYHSNGILTLNGVNMDSNISPLGGGAVATMKSKGLNILSSTSVTKNSAAFGGAFYVEFEDSASDRLNLDYKSALTIQYNDASSSGGAFFFKGDAVNPFKQHSELVDAIKDNGSPEQNANFGGKLINSIDYGKFDYLNLRMYFPTLSDDEYPSLKDLKLLDFFGNPISYTRRSDDAKLYMSTMKIVPSGHTSSSSDSSSPFIFYSKPDITFLPSKDTPDTFELNTIKIAAMNNRLEGSIAIQSPYFMNSNSSSYIPVKITPCSIGHVSVNFKDDYSICGLEIDENPSDSSTTIPLMVRIAILICICSICILAFALLLTLSFFVGLSKKRSGKKSDLSKESSKLLP
mmetsp:Transcript_7585/g.11254  ORF Transcript_7585/g.11254 Transcript_7585/m.11254 type:complete len:684 (+) Transcript_7585:55-2106(+)